MIWTNIQSTNNTPNILLYIDGSDNFEKLSHEEKRNHQIFDVLNSTMTRSRWLEDILWQFPQFQKILDQLNPKTVITEIGCGKLETLKDIRDSHPSIKSYGIDIIEQNPVEGIEFLKQDLLKEINIPKDTNIVFSTYAFPYTYTAFERISDIYNQLQPGSLAILNMGVDGLLSKDLINYINTHNDPEILRCKTTTKKEIHPKYRPSHYIIMHKKKDKEIDLPIVRVNKLARLKLKMPDGKYQRVKNADLMFHFDVDTIETRLKKHKITTSPKTPQPLS